MPETTQAKDGPRLLVVDDDRDICTALQVALQHRGHTVQTAHSGPEALKSLVNFTPDLVILDLMLPGIDGYAVLQEMRRHLGAKVPFLFVTATTLRISEDFLTGVIHSTMHKPLDFDAVDKRVRELLELGA
jgi:two-component system OmpR family response regulator